MKLSNEDKVLMGAGVVGLIGLFFLWKKKKEKQKADELANYNPEPEPAAPSSGSGSSSKPKPGATLDRNKLLKVGSKGLEVRELQRLLGVEIDGDFGTKETLPALQNAKGVSEISLNAFAALKKKVEKPTPKKALPKAAPPKLTLPKAGQKLMAAKDNTVIFKAKKIANGTYTNTGETPFFEDSLKYGDYVGVFKAAKPSGEYLIQRTGEYYFVKGSYVTPY